MIVTFAWLRAASKRMGAGAPILGCSSPVSRITTLKSDAGFSKKVVRGVSGGDRLLHTVERPAFLAKNRFGLPETLPFPSTPTLPPIRGTDPWSS